MELFKRKTNINFLGIRNITAIVSIVVIIVSLLFIFVRGLNLGLDFTGGYEVQLQSNSQQVDQSTIAEAFGEMGYPDAIVNTFGGTDQFMVRLPGTQSGNGGSIGESGESKQAALKSTIAQHLPDVNVSSLNYIGPQVGQELANKGILALVVAMICIMGYIAFRFEVKFALSAGISLLHDPIVILGFFAAFQISFGLDALAAMLAVIGFSLNDTIVIYDRIRENFRKTRQGEVAQVVNQSVNDTLSRTLITSGLTLMVVVVLFLFGGPSIHAFSLVLIIGVIVGTYSSIYVAGVLAVKFGLTRESLFPSTSTDSRP